MLYALKYLLRYIGVCKVKIILTPEKIFKGYGVRSTLLTDDIHKKVGPLQMRKEDEGYANKFIRF